MDKFKRAVKEIRDLRESDEREENEKKYDRWFKDLSVFHKSFVAYDFWDNASYEEKKREYESK